MLVVISAIFLIILTGGLYTYVKSNVSTQIWTRDRMQAKYTAEAGVNLATHMVVAGAALPTITHPPTPMLGTVASPEVLPNGMGSVFVTVDPNINNDEIISANAYMFNCVAFAPGDTEESYGLRVVVTPLNLARFSVFMDDPSLDGAYVDGYRFDGPLYANGPIRVISTSSTHENDPFFYSFELTSDFYISDWGNTHATGPASGNLEMRPFERLSLGAPYFELGVEPIPFGADEINWQGVRSAAITDGLYFGMGTVADGTRIRVVGNTLEMKQGPTAAIETFPLDSLENPVVWIDNGDNENIYIRGHGDISMGMDSALTIGMNGNLYLAGNLLYSNPDPEDPDNDCIVGLMTVQGDILLADDRSDPDSTDWGGFSVDTKTAFEVDAVLLALEGNLEAEDYHYPLFGPFPFTLMGGYMVQEEGYTSGGNTGFDISVYFDPRLLSMHPPFFPTTANWNTTMWAEVPEMTKEDVATGVFEW